MFCSAKAEPLPTRERNPSTQCSAGLNWSHFLLALGMKNVVGDFEEVLLFQEWLPPTPGVITATPPPWPVYICLDQKAAISKVVVCTTTRVFLSQNPVVLPVLSFVSTADALHQARQQRQTCLVSH